ncbi:MAG TPA: flagellar biosynthesis anti-sigma factor FlgM [Acidobacteriota bacterium]|nr:flagellar biosynthesis anti-sigma factor FlgM [Acidobacteriota bacterium]
MEIDGNNPLVGLNANVHRLDLQQQQQKVQKEGGDSPNPDGDRIELSVRSREIMHLDEMIRSTPDVREAKVEQVRSAIQDGTYNVRAEKIAEKIISGSVIDQVF